MCSLSMCLDLFAATAIAKMLGSQRKVSSKKISDDEHDNETREIKRGENT